MKIYKYRDLSEPARFERIEAIILQGLVWCARPDTLNDPDEFSWSCDYTPSDVTVDLVVDFLAREQGLSRGVYRPAVRTLIETGQYRVDAESVVAEVVQQCRGEFGLACFGESPSNDVLWKRYAGDGAGVAIEFEVPDALLGDQLHRVRYASDRSIHVDSFLRSALDRAYLLQVYIASLLTKSMSWASEGEVRFVSKRQQVNVSIAGSSVTSVVVGDRLPSSTTARLRSLVGSISLEPRPRPNQAMEPTARGAAHRRTVRRTDREHSTQWRASARYKHRRRSAGQKTAAGEASLGGQSCERCQQCSSLKCCLRVASSMRTPNVSLTARSERGGLRHGRYEEIKRLSG